MNRTLALVTVLAGAAFASPALATDCAGGAWCPEREWSQDAVQAGMQMAETGPLKSEFLGDVGDMQGDFAGAQYVWFAEDFDASKYSSVTLAEPTNGMGRFHVTGQELLRDKLGDMLKRYKPWKKAIGEGTDGDLVIYTNIRYVNQTVYNFAMFVELIAVDKDGKVVVKLQNSPGKLNTGKGGAAMAVMGGGMAGAIPDESEQFARIDTTTSWAALKLSNSFIEQGKLASKGKEFPSGPAVDLHTDRASLEGGHADAFGADMKAQVDEYLAIVTDPNAEVDDRRDRARDLGKIGAIAAVPAFRAIVDDKDNPGKLRNDVVWALGEIGHPDALDTVEGAKGVGKTKKYAATKISEY